MRALPSLHRTIRRKRKVDHFLWIEILLSCFMAITWENILEKLSPQRLSVAVLATGAKNKNMKAYGKCFAVDMPARLGDCVRYVTDEIVLWVFRGFISHPRKPIYLAQPSNMLVTFSSFCPITWSHRWNGINSMMFWDVQTGQIFWIMLWQMAEGIT